MARISQNQNRSSKCIRSCKKVSVEKISDFSQHSRTVGICGNFWTWSNFVERCREVPMIDVRCQYLSKMEKYLRKVIEKTWKSTILNLRPKQPKIKLFFRTEGFIISISSKSDMRTPWMFHGLPASRYN